MKRKLILRMYLILIITVLAAVSGVYGILQALSYRAMMADIRERADGVREYIQAEVTVEDFTGIGAARTDAETQETLDRLKGVGNLRRLYYARADESGALVTTLGGYAPEGEAEADLRRSLRDGVMIQGSAVYQMEDSGVYTVFWPVLREDGGAAVGSVCMEFDVDAAYRNYRKTAAYSLALSGALIFLCSVVAYLSITLASEPFYKKLAYTDFLTGCENRMAFEQRLRECEELCAKGGSVTMLVFDVNDLKKVNDGRGHKAGDQYLKNTADTLARHLGKAARLYRIGGDEFAALLVSRAKEDLEKLLAAIGGETKMMIPGQRFSCAFGAASFTPGVDNTLRDVFGRADRAMYEEKKRQKGTDPAGARD